MSDKTLEAVDSNGSEWDTGWASLERPMVQLYTRASPQTIHEFWQRCYFEDLWARMGSAAPRAQYLELGAGRGTTSMYLASRGCDVTMVDLSSAGFKVAQANFAREGLRLPTLVQADARQTDLPPASFDCIFNIGLLEHFADPRPVLAESVRLLRPGGLQFAVVIPDRPTSARYLAHALFCPWLLAYELMPESLREGWRKLRGRSPAGPKSEVLRTAYTRPEYVGMLDGLDVVDARCVPYNPYHPVYDRAFLEAKIVIPLYRAHRAIKRRFIRDFGMATAPALASCDLLTFRKVSSA
jgi:ubiquinone/menaquinone biosynthesis C-methylase UbiE